MYKKVKLKELVEYYDEINKNGEFDNLDDLQGINSNKYFQKCKSNKNEIDLNRYRICRNNTFAYNKATSRNGEKISIAYRTDGDCLISPSYNTFKIKNKNIILPEYLLLQFSKSSFDRYARFNSWGSATEFLNWDDFCNMEIKMVDIQKQEKIVTAYKKINSRLKTLNDINIQLNKLAKIIFKKEVINLYNEKHDIWKINELKDVCDVKGGKRLPVGSELQEKHSNHPYIRVRDISDSKFVVLNNNFQYISDEVYEKISRYIVRKNDVVISIVGTIGLVGMIHESLDGANLTENCIKITNFKNLSSDYIYYTISNLIDSNEILERIVGAVQSKLPIYNIQTIPIIIPDDETLNKIQKKFNTINKYINQNIEEIRVLEKFKYIMMNII